jgi:hypothetical protein
MGYMDGHERRATAEVDEVERKLRLGQHMELIPDLLQSVEAEPLRVRRWRELMLALYQRCRLAILDESGLEPSVETLELERAILLDRVELNWTGPDSIAY